jgi:hypothetical protein
LIRGEFGQAFQDWAAVTPAFLPRLSQWRPWVLPLSWKNVLRREFSGLFALVALFVALHALREVIAGRPVVFSGGQRVALLAGLLVYLLLFALRRWTRLLHEQPR